MAAPNVNTADITLPGKLTGPRVPWEAAGFVLDRCGLQREDRERDRALQ